jgi:Heavy metal binding domain
MIYTCPMHPEVQQEHPGAGSAVLGEWPRLTLDAICAHHARGLVGGLAVLRLAAQPDHCRRRDEPEFHLAHQQRLVAAEDETVS